MATPLAIKWVKNAIQPVGHFFRLKFAFSHLIFFNFSFSMRVDIQCYFLLVPACLIKDGISEV